MNPLSTRIILSAMILMLLSPSAIIVSSSGPVHPSELPAAGGPGISNISFSHNLTTGDGFSISVKVTDTFGVDQVRLIYNWSASTPSSLENISMERTGSLYIVNLTNPPNSTDPFWYRISTNNSKGQWTETMLISKEVKDNDPPVFASNGSDPVAYTGDPYVLRCTMFDNIGVYQVMANLTFDNRTYYLAPMCGAGNTRSVMFIIPSYRKWPLWYRFLVSDLAENRVWSRNFTAPILDNDPPVIMGDLTNSTPMTGEPFTIRFWTVDNWEVQKAWLTYSLGGKGGLNVTFGRSDPGNFTHTMDIPPDVSGGINYTGYFQDRSGNLVITETVSLPIRDIDPPVIVSDLSDERATTGDPLKLSFRVRDNIGVREVWVRYQLPGHNWYDSPAMDEGNGVYSIQFKAPSNHVGRVDYMLLATDTSGNSLVSKTNSIDLLDNDPPELIFRETGSEAYNGEWFAFNCAFSDNLDQTMVALEYYIDGNFRAVNMGMVERYGSGHLFTAGIDVPINAGGTIEYRFRAVDPSGNTVTTDFLSVPVRDDIPPVINRIQYMDSKGDIVQELTTGEEFNVVAWTTDNREVDSVDYQFSYTLSTRTGSGQMFRGLEFLGERSWNTTIRVPSDHTGEIVFTAMALDLTGNMFRSISRVSITDNDPPELWAVNVPVSIGTGRDENVIPTGTISFRARDNLGPVNATVIIDSPFLSLGPMRRDGSDFETDLSPTGEGLGFVMVNITVSDGRNNRSIERFVQIVDDTPPSIFLSVGSSYRDDTRIDLVADVRDLSPWNVEGVILIMGETAVEVSEVSVMGSRIIAWFFPIGPGNWTVQITVTDMAGNGRVLTAYLLIKDVTPPVFTSRVPERSSGGGPVLLRVNGASDPSGISSVRWLITGPDGENLEADGENASFEPWMGGDYRVRVNVTDGVMNSAMGEHWVSVTDLKEEESKPNLAFIVMMIITLVFGALLLLYLFRERIIPERPDTK